MKYLLYIAFLFLTACGVSENIKPGTVLGLNNRPTILMLGFEPKEYRLHLMRGKIENNIWSRPTPDVPEVNIFSTDGYIIVKLDPTTPDRLLGVGTIFLGYAGFGPCQNSVTPVFELKKGAVNYVGHLTYHLSKQGLSFDSAIKNDEARDYLKKYYPSFVDYLVYTPMKVVKVNSNYCTPKTIPIYVK